MFENEANRIINCYYNSIELIRALNTMYAPYEYHGRKYGQIFDIGFRLVHEDSILNRAKEALKHILQYQELRYRGDNQESLEEMADIIKATTIDDFYYALVEYIPNNSSKDYEIDEVKIYKENRVYSNRLLLILNCLWLLDNDEPIDSETRNRIYKISENGETFVFMNCKVTRHKNGNLKIVFSDNELYKRFRFKFDEALNKAIKVYEERYKE